MRAACRCLAFGSQRLAWHGMGRKVFLVFSVRTRSYRHSCGLRKDSPK